MTIPGDECGPRVSESLPVVLVQYVRRTDGIVPLSESGRGQQTGRALPADLPSLEVLVIIIRPGSAQSVHLRNRLSLTTRRLL